MIKATQYQLAYKHASKIKCKTQLVLNTPTIQSNNKKELVLVSTDLDTTLKITFKNSLVELFGIHSVNKMTFPKRDKELNFCNTDNLLLIQSDSKQYKIPANDLRNDYIDVDSILNSEIKELFYSTSDIKTYSRILTNSLTCAGKDINNILDTVWHSNSCIASSDGGRLYMASLNGNDVNDRLDHLCLRTATIKKVLELAKDFQANKISLYKSGNEKSLFMLESDFCTIELQTKIIPGSIPYYTDLVPVETMEAFEWDRDQLKEALINTKNDVNSVTKAICFDAHRVSCKNDLDHVVEIKLENEIGKHLTVTFNHDFLADALKILDKQNKIIAKVKKGDIKDFPVIQEAVRFDCDQETVVLMPLKQLARV